MCARLLLFLLIVCLSSMNTGYLRGAEVVGEIDLVVTNEATSYSWEGRGFKLSVPKSSLPEGTDLEEGLQVIDQWFWCGISHRLLKYWP